MLLDQKSELTPEESALCSEKADEWEGQYRLGMTYMARAGSALASYWAGMEDGPRLDHPHIYQYLAMLDSRYPEVREQVSRGAWDLRHNRFTIRFLSYFATKTAINPFMAVETVRMTREENERAMRRSNLRRMREAIRVLGEIGVDYMASPDDYDLGVAEPDNFVRKWVVAALYEIADEDAISDVVGEALSELREADQSGRYFRGLGG
jgi:hypothetical protein